MFDKEEFMEKVKTFFSKYYKYFIGGAVLICLVLLIVALIPKTPLKERVIASLEKYIKENKIVLTGEERYFSFEDIGVESDNNCLSGGLVIADNSGYQILYICDNKYSDDLNKILASNQIELAGPNPFYIKRGNFFVEPGYAETNDLVVKSTEEVGTKVGIYVVNYEAYGGNVPLKSKRIVVMTRDDFESYPIINLRGNQYETILQGRNYDDAGYYAYDSKDGEITANVKKTGNVNTSKVGLYQIRYSVVNSSGNSYESVRNVNVVKDTSPVNFKYTITPTTKTTESVKINIKVSGSNYRYTLKPNNAITSLNDFDYDVTENGTYKFIVKKIDGDYIEEIITVSNIEKKSEESQSTNFKDLKLKISSILPHLNTKDYSMYQIATFAKGKIVETYSSGCTDNTKFYLSSATKSILGIVAAKMDEDNIISLTDEANKYWYRLHDMSFSTHTSEWRSMMGAEGTLIKHTNPTLTMFQNGGNLINFLTHSSTVMNMNMVHMIPNDETSEYFGGSISSNYGRAAFMLHHVSGQLFEAGKVPGRTTSYKYQKDDLTREHSIAGFTMQIAMKESINEYMKKNILNKVSSESNPAFRNGNSIYFAAGYESSAKDVASIIAAIANDGVYEGNRVFSEDAVRNLEIKYSNLGNQTIAFDYNNGKYFKYGNYSGISYFGVKEYDLASMYNYYNSYISYDPQNGYGFVITVKLDSSSKKSNTLDSFIKTADYFYKNA